MWLRTAEGRGPRTLHRGRIAGLALAAVLGSYILLDSSALLWATLPTFHLSTGVTAPACPLLPNGTAPGSLQLTRPPPLINCSALGLIARDRPAILIDTFMYSNEGLMLLLRMAELDGVVDYFLPLESNVSMTGLHKPLQFSAVAGCFDHWTRKRRLRYTVAQSVGLLAPGSAAAATRTAWDVEATLRNELLAAAEGVLRELRAAAEWQRNRGPHIAHNHYSIRDEDVVLLVSDVDEIPHPAALAIVKACTGYAVPVTLVQQVFYYYTFNWVKPVRWERGPWAIPWSMRSVVSPQDTREKGKAQPSREPYFLNPAGWHLSYFMPVAGIVAKLATFPHTEYNRAPFNTAPHIATAMRTGRDLFDREGEHASWVNCSSDNADAPAAFGANMDVFAAFCQVA